MEIKGRIIDVHSRRIYPGRITLENGIITDIAESENSPDLYIIPGLIDAHVHIESSMCTPGSFAAAAVSRGTTGVVTDPHEIANVLGMAGVNYMIADSKKVPLKFWFGAPSCVPATSFETSGASLDPSDVEELLSLPDIKYLAEMMNFPGVINNDSNVIEKINSAKTAGKPVDGHAPGLTGADLKKYISAGITTDHECNSADEAREKILYGMKILIREGSAARNLDALKDLFRTDPEKIMLCSDDLHPEMLEGRHIDKIVSRLISEGYNLFDVIRSCTVNPAEHYHLNAGLLRIGHPADFIIVRDYHNMEVLETWIDGKKVYDNGQVLFNYDNAEPINNFNSSEINVSEIGIFSESDELRVIQAFESELFTKEILMECSAGSYISSDTSRDILKIVVKDRYRDHPPATAFIRGFGLSEGAIASSVAHDSHNIICIGADDEDIVAAVNEVIKMKGGLAVVSRKEVHSLPLPIAGIMSDKPVQEVASLYKSLSEIVKNMGSKLTAPFMTLSFMALLVIPELKLSDRGLFNGNDFTFVPLFNKYRKNQ